MASIRTGIELQDGFSGILYSVINSVNLAIVSMDEMQQTMNADIDTSSLEGAKNEINQATMAVNELNAAMERRGTPSSPALPATGSSPVQIPIEPVVPNPLTDNPDSVEIPVRWESLDGLEVFTGTNLERFGQEVADISSKLEQLEDVQYRITQQANESEILSPEASHDIRGVENRVQALRDMIAQVEGNPLNIGADASNAQLERLRAQLDQTLQLQDELDSAMQGMDIGEINAAYQQLSQRISDTERFVRDAFADIPPVGSPEPVTIPVIWETDNLEVFTGSGVERFQQEIQSANQMLEQLSSTQDSISRQAYDTMIFSPKAFQDLNSLAVRIDNVRQRIQQIENNQVNFGTDTANSELEQMRSQLSQMIQQQNELNAAVDSMDVSAANDAYMRLSQTVGGMERHIRDNVDEQGRFNDSIHAGTEEANSLEAAVNGIVGAVGGMAVIGQIFSFASECLDAFDTQLNSELQLVNTLANTLDASSVTIGVDADTTPLQAALGQVRDKASQIQSVGIYDGDAMTAGAAELSTYMSDVNAVMSMMDTLSNYAMGMSGGGEVGTKEMVDYATQLGKALNGAYDGLTKKGFELSEAQKKIIDKGTDMEKALVLDEIINESWENLYETMSSTPEGKIIQMKNAFGELQSVVGEGLYPISANLSSNR